MCQTGACHSGDEKESRIDGEEQGFWTPASGAGKPRTVLVHGKQE